MREHYKLISLSSIAREYGIVTILIMLAAQISACAHESTDATDMPSLGSGELVLLELKSRVYGNTRNLRVLLPPSYHETDNVYPVFFFLDGLATMDAPGLDLPRIVANESAESPLREFIIVAIDNGGSTTTSSNPSVDRASEYLPYADPYWIEPPIPKPRGTLFPEFLFEEVMPIIVSKFRVAVGPANVGPANVGLGGSSFGGLVTLYTLIAHPDRLGMVMIESPSLHVSQGRLENQLGNLHEWTGKMHIGVGSAEGELVEYQREMARNVLSLVNLVYSAAPRAELNFEFANGGTHWYDAWRARLPGALRFLFQCESDDLPGCQRVLTN